MKPYAKVTGLIALGWIIAQAMSANASLSSARIIDGIETVPGEFSEVFAMTYPKHEEEEKTPLCTAVLIHPRLLLTAGHCLPADDTLPLTLTNDSKVVTATHTWSTTQYYRHPKFDAAMNEMDQTAYDFGVIVLPEAITGITPSPLASLANLFNRRAAVTNGLTVVGYGGKIQLEDDESSGIKRFARTTALEATYRILSTSGPRSAASLGDSGAPAYLRDSRGRFHLIGIASGTPNGKRFQRTGLPDSSLYAGIRQEILLWIESTTSINLEKNP